MNLPLPLFIAVLLIVRTSVQQHCAFNYCQGCVTKYKNTITYPFLHENINNCLIYVCLFSHPVLLYNLEKHLEQTMHSFGGVTLQIQVLIVCEQTQTLSPHVIKVFN